MQYYVQQIAGNYLRNLTDGPVDDAIHPRFLHGLDINEFKNGFLALRQLMRDIYADIINDPASCGVPLVQIKEQNPMGVEYTKSHDGFKRIPNAILAIGVCGVLNADMTITLEGAPFLDLIKCLKITKAPEIFSFLTDYGFEIAGLGKNIKSVDILTVSYPDCTALTAALKSMAEAQNAISKGDLRGNKCYFYMLTPEILTSDPVKEPKLDFDSMYYALNENNRAIAKALNGIAAGKAKAKTKTLDFMRNRWTCTYTGVKSKQVLMTLKAEQDDLRIKLNLEHIDGYIGAVNGMPEEFKCKLRDNAWNCGKCNGGCAGGFEFTLDGVSYNKCRAGAFAFDSVSVDETTYLKILLENEMQREY